MRADANIPQAGPEELKRIAGERAVSYVKDGMVLGLGTGSTVKYSILKIGALVREGWDLVGVATSVQTERLAGEQRIPLSSLEEHPELDLTIDGADEVDPRLDLIKGLGGALLREKIVAAASKFEIIVVDESKLVSVLGTKAPLPVEVFPFSAGTCVRRLAGLGCEPAFRMRDGRRFVTDQGNHILDCRFAKIDDPRRIEAEINNIPGVLENGLFLGMTDRVVVAAQGGVREMTK